MYKLGHLVSGLWVEHAHPAVFRLPATDEESPRVVAGVPQGDPEVFARLTACLEPPYHLLYVLHTPRGEGAAGRYQSPPLGHAELRAFMAEFGAFLARDARFDLWAHSPAENATVVWDRHNQLFGYGPLDRFAAELRALGFVPGEPEVAAPHEHHYHAGFDAQAAALLRAFDWSFSPLRAEDEQ